MIDLDLDYVKRSSPGLDLIILLRTVRAVTGGKGAY
jgi:lipopolysaccharide/colanic/teichoic acid biosynthesis glycosyltransferase